MHIFLTGATGWVGAAIVRDMVAAGHRVTGLARDPAKAATLTAAGGEACVGQITDLDLLRARAAAADAVVHTAFNHDFTRFAASCAEDEAAIGAFGDALAGTDKPLLVTGGVAGLAPGRVATEADVAAFNPGWPRRSEQAAAAQAERGVRVAVVRLSPTVHGHGDHGFIPILIGTARQSGVAAYVGDGGNRWPAVHRDDAARLYRLALESGVIERVYHATAEEGVPMRDIADVIGRRLRVPVEPRAPDHFGGFGMFAAGDFPASSTATRAATGWQPTGPTLLADLDDPAYFQPGTVT